MSMKVEIDKNIKGIGIDMSGVVIEVMNNMPQFEKGALLAGYNPAYADAVDYCKNELSRRLLKELEEYIDEELVPGLVHTVIMGLKQEKKAVECGKVLDIVKKVSENISEHACNDYDFELLDKTILHYCEVFNYDCDDIRKMSRIRSMCLNYIYNGEIPEYMEL